MFLVMPNTGGGQTGVNVDHIQQVQRYSDAVTRLVFTCDGLTATSQSVFIQLPFDETMRWLNDACG